MSRGRLLLISLSSVVVLAAVVIGLALRRGPQINISTAAVTSGTIAREIIATGTLTPVKTVEAGSQVSGTVKSLEADFNTVVHAGQVVMRLDPAVYEAELQGARGKLAQAQAEWQQLKVAAEDAGIKLSRAEALFAQELIPRADLDAAQIVKQQADADLKAKAADIEVARALVDQAQVNLAHTVIRSPIDGVVVNRRVDVGQTIAAVLQSPVLFDIADLRHMQVLAVISEADVGGVRSGAHVTFQVESMGTRNFDGTVAEVRLAPVVEQAAATSGTSTGTGGAGATSTSGPTGQTSSPQSTGSPQSTSSVVATSPSTSGPNLGAGITGVVSYTAVIDVDNSEGTLTPGATALITIPGAERTDVVRIPNTALTFRPTQEMLEAIGQAPPNLERPGTRTSSEKKGGGKPAYVWRFEGDRFVPVEIVTGLADDRWTELLSGPLQAGQLLVTNATLPRR